MKHILLFAILCCATGADAATQESLRGFSLPLPEAWILVNKETPAFVDHDTDLRAMGFAGAFTSSDKLSDAENKIANGEAEYVFRTSPPSGAFIDNIRVQLIQAVQGTRICLNREEELGHSLGEQVTVKGCTQQDSRGLNRLSYRYIKVSDRLNYHHDEYQITPSVVLLLAGTSRTAETVEMERLLSQIGDGVADFFHTYPLLRIRIADLLAEKQYALAVPLLGKLAAVGETHAEYDLGLMYESGYGVEIDYDRAHDYYEHAAAKGNMLAVTNLAGLYFNGAGRPKDIDRAVQLYKSAAEAGVAIAQTNYAGMLINGLGVTANLGEAIDWYLKAALAGEHRAGTILTTLYQAEAAAGNVEALRMLAAIFLEGTGVPRNVIAGA